MTIANDCGPTYRIHPGIGVARLGDSPAEFCISPEKPAALPIDCDGEGNALLTPDGSSEVTITKFKDAEGRIKRQAARFQIYIYDEESPTQSKAAATTACWRIFNGRSTWRTRSPSGLSSMRSVENMVMEAVTNGATQTSSIPRHVNN